MRTATRAVVSQQQASASAATAQYKNEQYLLPGLAGWLEGKLPVQTPPCAPLAGADGQTEHPLSARSAALALLLKDRPLAQERNPTVRG